MEFRDLYKLPTMAPRYEKILLDEQEMKNSTRGTYYKDPNLRVLVIEYDMDFGEVDMAELICKQLVGCKALYRATEGTKALRPLRSQPSKLGRFTLLT